MTIKEAQLILLCTNIIEIMYCVAQGKIPESYVESNLEDEDGDPCFDLPTLQKEAAKVLLKEFKKQEKVIDKMGDKLSNYMTKLSNDINYDNEYANGHVYMKKEEIIEEFKQEVENEIQTD